MASLSRSSALAALALTGLWPSAAAAAPGETPRAAAASERARPEVAASRPAERPPPRQERAQSYATALTLAYTFAPLLAIPAGAALFELTGDDTVAVLGAGLAVVAVPVTAHLLHGERRRAARSGVFLPLATFGGVLVGSVVGVGVGSAGCDGDSDCELAGVIGGAILGGLLGGLAGYVSYAIYDVASHSSHDAPRAAGPSLQLWARPLHGRSEEQAGAAGGPRLGGAMLGVALGY